MPRLPYYAHLWFDLLFDPVAPGPGIYAIGVTNLWELLFEEKVAFAYFRNREPDDRIGYFINIYVVEEEE